MTQLSLLLNWALYFRRYTNSDPEHYAAVYAIISKRQFHDAFIFITVDFYESETLIEFLGGVVALDIAEVYPAVLAILFYGFQHRFGCSFAVSFALLPLVYEHLAQIVAFQVR